MAVETCFVKNDETRLIQKEKDLVLRMKGLMDGNAVLVLPSLKAF